VIGVLLLLFLQDDPKIAKEVEYANDPDHPQYQDQAMRKLRARGASAVPAILEFVEKKGRNKLAIFFTEFLGEMKDERVAKLLADLVQDKDFFWRPAAAKALAAQKRADDRELFRKLLVDRLWGVRVGAILGLEAIVDKEAIPELRKRLNDDIYDVRAQAAKTLHAFGDEGGLPVLIEALSSNVTWFEIDYGQIAREDAWNFLKKLTKDDFGFKPWETPEQRAPGLKKWHDWIAAKDVQWRDKVPEKARVKEEKSDYVFGFELRSCQKGDFFFRLDAQGNLVVGFFNLESVKLTDGECARIEKALDAVRGIDRTVPYGRGGCDFEQYYLKNDRGGFDKLWIGMGGRPGEGDVFSKTVAEILRARFGEGMANEFREVTGLFRGHE
jgi:hypothetical protein